MRPASLSSCRPVIAAAVLSLAVAPALARDDTESSALKARQEQLRPELEKSAFGRPIALQSGDSTTRPQGDVYAVMAHGFDTLGAALKQPQAWCDILLLQTNIKRCTALPSALRVGFVRKSQQAPEEATVIEFNYTVKAASRDFLSVRMTAPSGPVGTTQYTLGLDAVDAGNGKTFVHMSYAYSTSVASRFATDAYLATSGREKVGFSVTGQDAEGKPTYVGGIRGVAERNTMRYYLAIESYLATLSAPESERTDRRLEAWFDATARHRRQLKEMDRDEYLSMKRKELPAAGSASGSPSHRPSAG